MSFSVPDSLFLTILLFIAGLISICIAGDKFVDASVAIAKRLRIPQIVVGATIVSIGTTLPEVLVSSSAALGSAQSPEICVGNALGSIICNTAFIAGLGQLIRPAKDVKNGSIGWRLIFFCVIAVAMFAVAQFNHAVLPRWFGIVLLLGFCLYAFLSVKFSGRSKEKEGADLSDVMGLPRAIIQLILCAGLLYVGSNLLVENGQLLAQRMGVPDRVIAVTMIALGTSLPELVTTLTSVIKGQADVGLGNIIGANLFNFLLVIGLPTAIAGNIPMTSSALYVDLPLALLVLLALIVPMMLRKKGSRIFGGGLVLTYIGYCIYSFLAA